MKSAQPWLESFARDHRSSLLGAILRLPLRLVPPSAVLPILTGPLKGTRWVAGSYITRCWIGTYEIEKQRQIERMLRPGQVAYDVGAHSGFFTLLFSRLVGAEGRVMAFEPVPANVVKIVRHLDLNEVQNVSVFPLAISSGTGFSGFQAGVFDSSGQLSTLHGGLMVPLTSIDEIVQSGTSPPPDLLKIDVEGAELEVLKGARLALESKRAVWFVALHGDAMLEACPRLLEQYGYQVSWISREGSDPAGRRLGEIVAVPTHNG